MAEIKATDRANLIQSGALALCVLLVLGMSLLLFTRSAAQARSAPGGTTVIVADLKYLGNATCAAKECHGADKPKVQSGQNIGDESSIWSASDPHAKAFKTLSKKPSKDIAAKLKIDDATTSARCLSCHAMDVPAKQRGELFAIDDAVGCESCHGPAEKWNEPHKKAGWTMEQRKALGSAKLFDTYGLNDTSNLAVRARTCVACHLQIDKDMVDAGHPALEFELYAYSYYVSKDPKASYQPHWDEATGVLQDARLWASGQIAADEAATAQVDAWTKKGWDTAAAKAMKDLYDAGKQIVKDNFGADSADAMQAVKEIKPESIVAARAALVKWSPAAKDATSRRTVADGVAALGSALFEARGVKETPDTYWAAYKAARAAADAGGDAYADNLKKMVDLSK